MGKEYRVLITSGSFGKAHPEAVDILTSNHCLTFKNPESRPLHDDELAELVRHHEIDAIIAGLDEIGPQTLAKGTSLKVVSRHGTGIDNVDLPTAEANGITVTNTPSTNAEAVADLVIALVLMTARRLVEVHSATQRGDWKRPMGLELTGRTLGLIGYGKVGQAVGRRAKGFSMSVMAYDPYVSTERFIEDGVQKAEFDDIIKNADVISLHIPKTAETSGLINASTMARFRKDAILINTSRGDLVDEEALVQAVRNGQLWGAGFDVYDQEPPINSSLLGVPEIVTTSHIGALTDRALRATSKIAAENVVAVLNGNPCTNIVRGRP